MPTRQVERIQDVTRTEEGPCLCIRQWPEGTNSDVAGDRDLGVRIWWASPAGVSQCPSSVHRPSPAVPCHLTRQPPDEQWLVGLGVGGGPFSVMVGLWCCLRGRYNMR
jgi:hypothetical protein